MPIWIAIAGLILITVLTRAFFLLWGERVRISPQIQRTIRYAPAAALAAIIVSDVFYTSGANNSTLVLPFYLDRFCAAMVTIVCFLWKRNMFISLIIGMLTYTVIRIYL